jgi:hypothetical protein
VGRSSPGPLLPLPPLRACDEPAAHSHPPAATAVTRTCTTTGAAGLETSNSSIDAAVVSSDAGLVCASDSDPAPPMRSARKLPAVKGAAAAALASAAASSARMATGGGAAVTKTT